MAYEINVAITGTGFMGPTHTEALRRLGINVVGVLGSSPEKSSVVRRTLGHPQGLPHLRRDRGRRRRPGGPHHHAEPLAFRHGQGRHAGRETRPGREAAGHDLPGVGRDSRRWPDRLQVAAGVNYNYRFYPVCPGGSHPGAAGRPGADHLHCRRIRAGLAALPHRLQLAGAGRRGRQARARWPTSAPIGSTWCRASPA